MIAILQVIGLLPVLTWLSNLHNVTDGMWVIAFIKALVMLLTGSIYFWLGKIKSRIDNSGTSDSEGRLIIFSVLGLLVLGVILTMAIPVLSKWSQKETNASIQLTQPAAVIERSIPPVSSVLFPCPEGEKRIAGELECLPLSQFTPISATPVQPQESSRKGQTFSYEEAVGMPVQPQLSLKERKTFSYEEAVGTP
ncbi:hypothetical protein ACFO6X_15655 [Giesbergeria sinuosa]|uniref:Uncharacterized protein n=1 Tax=Giesbergeria sinuosa TaxID=80883 RepID=A0ABV9QI33_9BURK